MIKKEHIEVKSSIKINLQFVKVLVKMVEDVIIVQEMVNIVGDTEK
jgi:hypothetical protein